MGEPEELKSLERLNRYNVEMGRKWRRKQNEE